MELVPFDSSSLTHRQAAVHIWNAACGADLAISERFLAYNTRPSTGGQQAGRVAMRDGQPVGFVLASVLHGEPTVNAYGEGWIDALVVKPEVQRHAIGGALLAWAEAWLVEQGCARVRLGASLRPFAPGQPTELGHASFFERRGYVNDHSAYDMSANLATYTPPPSVHEIDGAAQPAQPGQESYLLAFLRREFPGRWRYEAEEFLREHGRISDYMLLWTERGVDGCCLMTFEDSVRPMERYYPYRLPRPWGQVGSIGISADCRGRGYGAALLDASLRRLHANGVNGCVIDWTGLVDFYAKFGFAPYRAYQCLWKVLGSG